MEFASRIKIKTVAVNFLCFGYTLTANRYMLMVAMYMLPGMSHKLNDLCDYYGICLAHHQADSDSRACANILLRYIGDGADVREHIRTYSFDG